MIQLVRGTGSRRDLSRSKSAAIVFLLFLLSGFIPVVDKDAPAPTPPMPVDLVFNNFTLESGTAGQEGAVYRFTDVTPGVDARIKIVSLIGGASLTQIDDASPSSDPLQPQISGIPSNDPRIDFEVAFVSSVSSAPVIVTGFEFSGIDIDGASNYAEFTRVSGITEYTLEDPTELTVNQGSNYTEFVGPFVVYNGIDPAITTVIFTGLLPDVSRFNFSLGLTGTRTTSINRLSSISLTFETIIYGIEDTTVFDPQIGAAKSTGTLTDNLDGTYSIPYSIAVENYGDGALYDLQVTEDLTSAFGSFVAGTPSSEGTYTTSAPVLSNVSAGVTLDAGTPNAGFNGDSDTDLMVVVSGNELPENESFGLDFTVTFYPLAAALTQPFSNQVVASGDQAEDGIAGGATTDSSTTGTNPDANLDNDPSNDQDPTVFSIPIARIGAAKQASAITDNGDGTFDISFTLKAENTGNEFL
ncbi:MAG: hypothetical protein HKN43_05935 [Rhodothermales bacterium]|nr:hypothetical protein [Rhodothermales bacterium]